MCGTNSCAVVGLGAQPVSHSLVSGCVAVADVVVGWCASADLTLVPMRHPVRLKRVELHDAHRAVRGEVIIRIRHSRGRRAVCRTSDSSSMVAVQCTSVHRPAVAK
jgi:hypothetical protein